MKKDISGNTYGKITVIKFDRFEKGHYFYVCVCECGIEKSIRRNSLICGKVKSCGSPECVVRKDTGKSKLDQNKSLNDRFKKHVFPEPNTGCWLWAGSMTQYGYGDMTYSIPNENGKIIEKHLFAHRYSYLIHKGDPKDLFVCHTCDVRCCVNPDHLFLGTRQDNNNDKILKGRGAKGENVGTARLKEYQVIEIHQKYKQGISISVLSSDYSIGKHAIYSIIKGKSWTYLSLEIQK